MAKKRYWNTEAKNARWIKQGRGQGVGSEYKPWLTVRDVPSEGRSHRVFGHLTQRTHHLLSDLELATFLLLQWRTSTLDIREQFPLDITITKQLCKETGIPHPANNGVPQFMSTDFVVNSTEKDKALFAIQVKDTSALRDARTVEKLEIERRFWRKKNTPWYLVTEKEVPAVVFKNIEWLYSLQSQEVSLDDESQYFDFYSKQIAQNSQLTVIDICKQIDTAYGLELGESLFQLRLLLARRYFHFDISIPYSKLRCSDLLSESFDTVVEVLHVSG